MASLMRAYSATCPRRSQMNEKRASRGLSPLIRAMRAMALGLSMEQPSP